jgi:hypothetical protein
MRAFDSAPRDDCGESGSGRCDPVAFATRGVAIAIDTATQNVATRFPRAPTCCAIALTVFFTRKICAQKFRKRVRAPPLQASQGKVRVSFACPCRQGCV